MDNSTGRRFPTIPRPFLKQLASSIFQGIEIPEGWPVSHVTLPGMTRFFWK